MSPAVADLMRRAEYHLREAEGLLADGYGRVAAREGYQAMFHAAQAATREAFGKTPKTHSGLIARFGELCVREPSLGPELGRRLARGYQAKDTADYGPVEEAEQLRADELLPGARELLARVRAFVSRAPDPAA